LFPDDDPLWNETRGSNKKYKYQRKKIVQFVGRVVWLVIDNAWNKQHKHPVPPTSFSRPMQSALPLKPTQLSGYGTWCSTDKHNGYARF